MDEGTLEKLLEIGGLILASDQLAANLAPLNGRVTALLNAERCVIYLVDRSTRDPEHKELQSRVQAGEVVEELRVLVEGQTYPAYVARTGEELAGAAAALREQHPSLQPAVFKAESLEDLHVVPIRNRGEVVGVLEVINARGEVDRDVVDKLIEYLSVALNTARMTLRLKRAYNARRSLEQILVDEGVVSSEKMEDAIFQARSSKRPVHKVLNSLYALPEREYARAMAIKYDKQFFEWTEGLELDAARLRRVVPERAARDADIVPLRVIRYNGEDALQIVVTAGRFLKRNLCLASDLEIREVLIGAKADVSKLRATLYLQSEVPRDRAGMHTLIRALEDGKEGKVDRVDLKRGANEEDGPIVNLVQRIIEDAYRLGASDIHIEPRSDSVLVRYRKDGTLRKVLTFPIHARRAVVARIKILAGLDITVRMRPQDGKISFKEWSPGALSPCAPGTGDIDVRVGTLPTVGDDKEDVVMRLLPNSGPVPLEDLRMRPYVYHEVRDLIEQPYGLFLVVGPTGSGKTTTLHSCLNHISRPEVKVLTVEDPVEITHPDLRQVQVNRKAGLGFPQALRQFLRQDPDVIMVGECRDEETAQITLEASLTGHLVFSTLHTNSAAETITRLLEMGLEPFTFADALLGVLAQRLLRTLCSECKETWEPGAEGWAELGLQPRDEPLYKPVGCPACAGTGFRGRMAIHELLINSSSIRDRITSSAPVAEIFKQAQENGMSSLYEDGLEKVYQGCATIGEVRRVCIQHDD